MSLDNTIKLIQANIQAAKEHLEQIEAAMTLVETAGMYPAVPHFQWQRREELGEARYLYLVFRQNGNGGYMGPDGKKKVYIGADPSKIEEAKRLVCNRERHDWLSVQKSRLRGWIIMTENQIGQLDIKAKSLLADSQKWPKSELSTIGATDFSSVSELQENTVSI